MAYNWSADLETGNLKIDSQHRELINAINKLLDACSNGRGRAEIDSTLGFLNDYIIRHFNDEEALQITSRYPDYANHKQYHEGFKKSVRDIQADYQKGGADIVLVSKVNSVIASWLINHIKKEDVKVAAHLKNTVK